MIAIRDSRELCVPHWADTMRRSSGGGYRGLGWVAQFRAMDVLGDIAGVIPQAEITIL